jgi:hypothetical protein
MDLGVEAAERSFLVGIFFLTMSRAKSRNSSGSPSRAFSFQPLLGGKPLAGRVMNCLRRHKNA